MTKKIIVTGCAGFIGFHLSKQLLSEGYELLGIDVLNEYYDINLKKARLELLKPFNHFHFIKEDIANTAEILKIFTEFNPDYIVHLAAQAGVRYSISNPEAYTHSNLLGFSSVIEAARQCEHLKHFLYASSSSVYGANAKMPFSESDEVSHPMSLYAATKKANELVAHSYANIHGLPSTGLRFFTVYGPWGRPDMALFLFTQSMIEKKPIQVFNHGKMRRDFTYIDDVVDALRRLIPLAPSGDEHWDAMKANPQSSFAPYRILNLGNSAPEELMNYIKAIEDALDMVSEKEMLPMQPGDVPETYSDTHSLFELTNFKPKTTIQEGVKQFVTWYRDFYRC